MLVCKVRSRAAAANSNHELCRMLKGGNHQIKAKVTPNGNINKRTIRNLEPPPAFSRSLITPMSGSVMASITRPISSTAPAKAGFSRRALTKKNNR
jgi:hypothetical protein